MKPVFVLLVFLLLGVLAGALLPGGNGEITGSRGPGTPTRSPDGPRLRGDADARPPRPRQDAYRFRGIVVDADQAPCADAAVWMTVRGETAARTTTDGEGRFELRVPTPPGEGRLYGVLGARAEAGVALRMLLLRPDPERAGAPTRWQQVLGNVALRPSEPFDVRVVSTCESAPPAVLRLRHGVFHDGPDHLVVETDAEGRARVDGLHAGLWRVVATAAGCGRGTAFFHLPREDGAPVEVAVGPSRAVRVTVVDRSTGAPIEGAVLRVRERIDRPDGIAFATYRPALDVAPTDATGVTTLDGLGDADRLRITASAQGYPGPRGVRLRQGPGVTEVDGGATEARIELVASRTVSWPVVDGEVPAPPDGTVIRLRRLPQGRARFVPADGRIENGRLVVGGWGAGRAIARAEEPDGALAKLVAEADAVEGEPVAFFAPRGVAVRLAYPDGAPAEGFDVQVAHVGGRALTEAVTTDATGTARFEGLYGGPPGRVDVQVATGKAAGGGRPVGSVDLSKGDGQLEATVERLRDVVLRVRVDGRPGLPKSLVVGIGGDWFRGADVQRDEEGGVLRWRWRPAGSAGPTPLEVDAHGYVTVRTMVDVPPAPAAVETTVDLVRAGRLIAEITPPPDEFHRVQLQRWDEAAARWELAFQGTWQQRPPNEADDSGQVAYPPVRPGRYRVVESALGIPSPPVRVVAGDEPARVTLDLSHVVAVMGRIVVPEGMDARGLTVRAEGIPEPLASNRRPGEPRTRWVSTGTDREGRFEIRLPGDRPVPLVPYGRFLEAAPEGGRVVVRGARTDVVLRMVAAPVATITYDRHPVVEGDPDKILPLGIGLFAPGASLAEPPAHQLVGLLQGRSLRIANWEPGTWTLWIDAWPFAPYVRAGVELGDEDVDLGTLKTSDGASFVARWRAQAGEEAPQLTVLVGRVGPPTSVRRVDRAEGGVARVTGLGPGDHRVVVHAEPGGRVFDEVIELDGASTVERTVGP